MRAGTADREQVVAAIRSHWSVGRLTDEELEERVGKALSARTLGHLRKRGTASAGHDRQRARGLLDVAVFELPR